MKTFFLNRRLKKLNRKILATEKKIAGNNVHIEYWLNHTTDTNASVRRLPERICEKIVAAKIENAQAKIDLAALTEEKLRLMRQESARLKVLELADRARFP
jgi:hypothetical protein